MNGSVSSDRRIDQDLKALDRRADAILKARPAYREMVNFYLTVFRRQIEWRDKLVVHPQVMDDDQRRQCLKAGRPLVEQFDPGIESDSLLRLWAEMRAVFRRGNDVLRRAVDQIDEAERGHEFVPATWLAELRPDRDELVTDAAGRIGLDEPILAVLARAVTLPHWQLVARTWLPEGCPASWQRSRCPMCGGLPALAEMRTQPGGADKLKTPPRRFLHCPFCGTCWAAPGIKCPACDSTKPGDAKYYFTPEEPDLRVDFCKSCNHYVKVVDADKITGRLHLGLELLTTAHLDTIAQEKHLSPLEVCA
ncbi:MAG TPA: formate dehydrogenase accessory protein FdhE [Phycisphaerae bacterium]|nr:formate dehydrogenase accessory protein FdhE [Phycisphaerae bacterium]